MKGFVFGHFDIEADGPSPAHNNMISLGVVFTNAKGEVVQEFQADLKPLPNHFEDDDTMKNFWNANPENQAEYKRIKDNEVDAKNAMQALETIIGTLKVKRVVWVARPAAYDWQWLNYYWHYAQLKSSLGFKATCASTMRDIYQAQFGLNREQMEAQVKEWAGKEAMTHNPLDDARFQAKIFHALEAALRANKVSY